MQDTLIFELLFNIKLNSSEFLLYTAILKKIICLNSLKPTLGAISL